MKKITFMSLMLLFICLNAFTQEIKVTKITDKVIVLNFTDISNCNIVAISSHEGIILVDTEISTMTMEIVKATIQREFPNKKFLYVINTHAHAHHCGGNAVFKDIPIIAHENIVDDMQWWFDAQANEEMKQNFLNYIKNKISECEDSIKNNDNVFEVESLNQLIKYWKKRGQE